MYDKEWQKEVRRENVQQCLIMKPRHFWTPTTVINDTIRQLEQ